MGTTVDTVIITVVSVGVPGFFAYLWWQLRRRAQGKLVRVNKEEAEAQARELENTLQRSYIGTLREEAIKRGYVPPKPPKRLKL